MKLPYFLSQIANNNGEFEVHKAGCMRLPSPENRIFLQEHESCGDAIVLAKNHKEKVNTCYYCCVEMHLKSGA